VVYFSFIQTFTTPDVHGKVPPSEVHFEWVYDGKRSRRKAVEQRLGFVEFANFAEWMEAQKKA
jgi:hypothetical protein